MPPTALLLEGIHDAADVRLQSDFINVQRAPKLSDANTDTLKEAMAMGIRSRTHLDEEALRKLPALSAVGCFCIGTNQVDLNCAADSGIPVFNSPFSNTRSVAELVMGEIICDSNRLREQPCVAIVSENESQGVPGSTRI